MAYPFDEADTNATPDFTPDCDEMEPLFDRLDGIAQRAGQLTGAEARHVVTAINHLRLAEFHLRIAVEASGDPRFATLADRFRDGAAELAQAAVTFGEAGQPAGSVRH